MTIETVGIEVGENEEKYHVGTPMEHLTIKEAKAWIKEHMFDRDYWDSKAERKGFFREVKFIHILKDGVVHTEYLTNFA